jgi:hypothetical protein
MLLIGKFPQFVEGRPRMLHFGRAAEPKAWAMATAASKVSDPTTADQRGG